MPLFTIYKKHYNTIAVIVLALLISVTYSNTLNSPFVFDDQANIVNRQAIHITELSAGSIKGVIDKSLLKNRPVANISFALNHYISGFEVGNYHLVNIIIHFINGLLVYFIALLTFAFTKNNDRVETDERTIFFMALTAACLFVLHPVQTQSVTYIVQRMNSLSVMFYLAALLLFIMGRKQITRVRYGMYSASFVSWLLALGSKEIAATLPVVLFLYEWYFFRDLDKVWLKKQIPFVIIYGIILIGLSGLFIGTSPWEIIMNHYQARDFTMMERLLTEMRVLVFYLSLVVLPLPSRLNLLHAFPLSASLCHPITTLISMLFLVLLLILAINIARKQKLHSFCILWFYIHLAMESSFIGLEIIYEHRLYLPMVGICIAVSYLIFNLSTRLAMTTIICTVLCLFLGTSTYIRNSDWATAESIWKDVVSKNPESHRAQYNLGNVYRDQIGPEHAVRHYQKALEIKPDYSIAYNNLAMTYSDMGDVELAIELFLKAIQSHPENPNAYYNLALNLANKGNIVEAIRYYYSAIELKPDYAAAWYNVGNLHERLGELDKAQTSYRRAIKWESQKAEAYNNLGILLANQSKFPDAINNFNQAIIAQPKLFPPYINLAKLYLLLNEKYKACEYYEKAKSMVNYVPIKLSECD